MNLADYHFPKPLRQTVAQAARVICPSELEELGLVDYVVDYAELQLRAMPTGFRVALTAGLGALEVGSVFHPRTLGRRFSTLTVDEARAWYDSFYKSPIGAFSQLAHALKSLIALAFYDSAPMKRQLEYHPDQWIAEAARRRLAQWGADIARHEEMLRAPAPLLPTARLTRRVRHA